jgi:hypothetical protein
MRGLEAIDIEPSKRMLGYTEVSPPGAQAPDVPDTPP